MGGDELNGDPDEFIHAGNMESGATSLDKEKMRHKEYYKKRKEARESAGLCINCGKRRPENGKKQCTQCLARMKLYGAKYKAQSRARYRERIAQGLCGACGKKPPVEGRSTCAECAEKLRIRGKKKSATANNDPRNMAQFDGKCFYCYESTVIYLDKSYNRWMCVQCYIKRCQAIDRVRKSNRMRPKYKWLKEIGP